MCLQAEEIDEGEAAFGLAFVDLWWLLAPASGHDPGSLLVLQPQGEQSSCADVTRATTCAAPGTSRRTLRTAAISWVAVSSDPNRILHAVQQVIAQPGAIKGKTRRALDWTVLGDAVATQDTVRWEL